MEFKIRLFAKLMSVLFAAMALYALLDLFLEPKETLRFVLAHDCETGYRSTSKNGAKYYRDNYLICAEVQCQVPYRMRTSQEMDTLLTYQSVEVRMNQAQEIWDRTHSVAGENHGSADRDKPSFEIVKIPVDLKSYYDVEDGDSIRIFTSPWRKKVVGYTVFTWPHWLDTPWSSVKLAMKRVNPDINQWLLITLVFALISLSLSMLTWTLKEFPYSVGLFVFNCACSTMLHWIY